MRQEPQTFPTLRSWRRMSEREQDAFLDRVETRQRWRVVRSWAFAAMLCAGAAAVAVALLLAN